MGHGATAFSLRTMRGVHVTGVDVVDCRDQAVKESDISFHLIDGYNIPG